MIKLNFIFKNDNQASFVNFLKHAGFLRYFKNTGWLFLGYAINLVISFLVSSYVARYLGPANFGHLNYAISFVGLFGFLLGFGVDAILNRELVKNPEKRDDLISGAFWMKVFGGVLAVLIANVIGWFLNDNYLPRLLIFLFSLTFLFQAFGVVSLFFQAQVLAKVNVKVQIFSSLVSTGLKLFVIQFDKGIIWFTLIFVFETVFSSFIFWVAYSQYRQKIDWRINFRSIVLLLKDSWPFMFTVIATTIYYRIDQTMLKHMLDETAVGIYSVAVKLSEVWYFIPNILTASLFPAIINAKSTNAKLYLSRLGSFYRLMLVLALFIAIPSYFLARPIIGWLFGNEYLLAITSFKIYIWSGVPIFIFAAVSQYLIAENLSKIYFMANIFGSIMNIVLNIILIPIYGITGSAIATLISYSVPLLSLFVFKKTRGHLSIIAKQLKNETV